MASIHIKDELENIDEVQKKKMSDKQKGKKRDIELFLSFFGCLRNKSKKEIYALLKELRDKEKIDLEQFEKGSTL